MSISKLSGKVAAVTGGGGVGAGAEGEQGHVVNTSSGNGGVSPMQSSATDRKIEARGHSMRTRTNPTYLEDVT